MKFVSFNSQSAIVNFIAIPVFCK